METWERLRRSLAAPWTPKEIVGASCSTQGRVEMRLTESFSAIRDGRPAMRHRRCFSNASTEQILSLLLGLKFCGAGGLMVDSTADSEEDSSDGHSRFIKDFRQLGDSFGSVLAGSFNVRQELTQCLAEPEGVVATIQMSFSPARSKDHEPSGSFLWEIEPSQANDSGRCACWTELINTEETRSRRLPELRIKAGAIWIFQLGHNRLIQRAAQRIADVLNSGDDKGINFASYAQEARRNFLPSKCRENFHSSK